MKSAATLFALALGALGTLVAPGAGAADYAVMEVGNGGSVTGKVTFSGTDPDPKVFAITKDPETCGTGDRLIDFVKVKDGALSDVVVFLDKVKSGKAFVDSEAAGDLDQKGCEFHPFIQVMHNGAKIAALNSDPVSHNIHTYEILGRAKKTVFNVSQPDQGSVIKKTVKLKRGSAMKVECDQHDFMHGFVFVAKNPYYAVVGEGGTFSIDDVPPGNYTVKAWHGTLREKKAKVTVEAGKAAKVDFEFKGK
jgi:hypothetical protein